MSTITKEDWKAARAAVDAIEEERKALLEPTEAKYDDALERLELIEEQCPEIIGRCEGCSILSALTSSTASGEDGWQDISSAPTNKAILIHLPNTDYYGNAGVYAAILVDMGTGRRWMTFGWAIGRDVGPDNQPDKWMPMPLPSSSKEDGNA